MEKYFINNQFVQEGKIAVLKIFLSKVENAVYTVNDPLHNRTTLVWIGFQKDSRALLRESNDDLKQVNCDLFDQFFVDYHTPIVVITELIGTEETEKILKSVEQFIESAIIRHKKK